MGYRIDELNHWPHIIPDASQSASGVMAPSDKQALDALASTTPLIAQQHKDMVNNQITPLFTVDMTKIPDHSYGIQVFYALEATDGVNTQMRSGHQIMNVAQASNGTFATSVIDFSTVSVTFGTLTINGTWATVGNIATFRMQAASSLAPTSLHIMFYIAFVSHPASGALALSP